MDDLERRQLRSELVRLVTSGFEDFVSITLVGGEHYFIRSPVEVIVGRLLVRVYPGDGGEVFFPMSNVSSIEAH